MMDYDYHGKFALFDNSAMRTYPLSRRKSKVAVDGFVDPAALRRQEIVGATDQTRELAARLADAHRHGRPVILISGAHPIKNGLAPLFIDLMARGVVTLYATNGATTIHAFELALTGASSEDVRTALPAGEFGMAFETGVYLNQTLIEGHARGYGCGEAMGRLYCDAEFRKAVLDAVFARFGDTGEYLKPHDGFPYADSCVFARAFELGVPATVHTMQGTDIIDQHANYDPAAKGATSGRDFLIFTEHVTRLAAGGVVLNVGTAVMGPEVLLKAVSMAANVGKPPGGILTAVFDIRPFVFDDAVRDESQAYYYLRDQKSVATRIPFVFGGKGLYFQGDHARTIVPLYQCLMRELGVA
jgi:hypothetical protein